MGHKSTFHVCLLWPAMYSIVTVFGKVALLTLTHPIERDIESELQDGSLVCWFWR